MLHRKDIQQMEKLKLVIIYALRYETEEKKIETLKGLLRGDSKLDQVSYFSIVKAFWLIRIVSI